MNCSIKRLFRLDRCRMYTRVGSMIKKGQGVIRSLKTLNVKIGDE